MDVIETEILVVGGGIAGLIATAVLARAGFDCILLDAEPPDQPGKTDLRSTALLDNSVMLLQRTGLWTALDRHAAPLRTMRLLDIDSSSQSIHELRDFAASEIDKDQFGFNLPNVVLRDVLAGHLSQLGNVRVLAPALFRHLTSRSDAALVLLADGRHLRAQLVVAADGRHSAVRQDQSIGVRTWRYGQRAIVFTVSHPLLHQDVSTELHESGGPFTLVPLPDHDGTPRSAVVWMDHAANATALMRLSDDEFSQAASRRSCGVLGPLRLTGPRAVWPIISQLADRFCGERTALIAEAAHVVPPIGAQGLNTSLTDLSVLETLLVQARRNSADIGSDRVLTHYNRQRHPTVAARVVAIDALNRASMANSPLLRQLRRNSLGFLGGTAPLRLAAMRAGLA